tara:strand:+ start:11 stop:133 length:123 start_codon:yes stop_codon:yes gene_type:complete
LAEAVAAVVLNMVVISVQVAEAQVDLERAEFLRQILQPHL